VILLRPDLHFLLRITRSGSFPPPPLRPDAFFFPHLPSPRWPAASAGMPVFSPLVLWHGVAELFFLPFPPRGFSSGSAFPPNDRARPGVPETVGAGSACGFLIESPPAFLSLTYPFSSVAGMELIFFLAMGRAVKEKPGHQNRGHPDPSFFIWPGREGGTENFSLLRRS